MRSKILLAICALALAACGGQIDRDNIDGVDCVIARDNTGASPVAISCDWENAEDNE
jgi:hypothetical protein